MREQPDKEPADLAEDLYYFGWDFRDQGLWAAYVRAKEWGGPTRKFKGKARPRYQQKVYAKTARNAKRRLERRGYTVGKGRSGMKDL